MAIGDGLNNAKKNAEDLNKSLKDVANDAAFTENALKSIAQTFKDAISEAIEAANGLDSATKKVGSSLARDVVNNIKKLGPSLEKSISLQQKLNQGQDISADLAKEQLKTEAQRTAIEARILQLKNEGIATDDIEAALLSQIAAEEKEIARLREAQNGISEENAAKIQKANDLLGLTGKTLGALNALTKGFGSALGLDKVEAKMKAVAKETADANKNFAKMRVLAAGAGEAISQLGNNLMDPGFLLTNMIVGFNKVDKAATDFQQQTGQDLNTMSTSLTQFNGGLVTSAELIEAASDVTKEFGINAAAAFGMEDIGEIASMKKELGLSSKEASKLAGFSKLNAGNVEATEKGIISGINSANRQNKMAVSHGQVLRDVANVSSGIAITYAGFPEKLGEAAAAARGLGMNLEGLDKIASGLLDFESSIAAEMEAELLTGQALNLEKARELALNNDLAGLANELANQGITSAKFSKMNRLQQEAQAKAMNMSREQMADMLIQQGLFVGMSEKGLSDAQKVALEDMKRVDAQEKFATAIGKLQQALAPIVGFFADILSNSVAIYSIMGVALVSKIPALVGGFKSFKDNLSSGFKSIKGIAKGVKDLVKGGGGKAAGEAISSKVPGLDKGAKSIADSADKTKGIDPKQGSGIKQFLKGLGDGLASIGKQAGDVIKGGIAVGLALFSMGAGLALSLPLIAGTDPVLMIAFAAGISAIGLTVAAMGKVGKDIIKGALAMGIMAVALIPAAYAFSLLAGVDAASILAFSIAIPILGLSVMALGLIFTNPITMFLFGAGILGLLALGAAIMPLAAAFSMLANSNAGDVLSNLTSLSSAAPGLFDTANALNALASGLMAVGIASMFAGPSLGELNTNVNATAGGEEESGMAGVEAKLDKLISIVEAGGDVFIDGSKVGKTISLASSKMG